MTATPAQVANDLDAQASYFARSDADLARLCRDTARLIRQFQREEPVEPRAYANLHGRLLNAYTRFRGRTDTQIGKSIMRGLEAIEALRAADVP